MVHMLTATWTNVWNDIWKYHIHICYFTFIPHGRMRIQKWPAPNVCGFIAQLVRASHRYCEVTGSNPVEVLNFSGFYIGSCMICVHNCEDHSLLDLTNVLVRMGLITFVLYYTYLAANLRLYTNMHLTFYLTTPDKDFLWTPIDQEKNGTQTGNSQG